jgi:hypothetical protein
MIAPFSASGKAGLGRERAGGVIPGHCQRKEKLEHLDLTLGKSVQAKDRPLL